MFDAWKRRLILHEIQYTNSCKKLWSGKTVRATLPKQPPLLTL